MVFPTTLLIYLEICLKGVRKNSNTLSLHRMSTTHVNHIRGMEGSIITTQHVNYHGLTPLLLYLSQITLHFMFYVSYSSTIVKKFLIYTDEQFRYRVLLSHQRRPSNQMYVLRSTHSTEIYPSSPLEHGRSLDNYL